MNDAQELEEAISVAYRVHAGEVDKAGVPAILHSLRVMTSVLQQTASLRLAAVAVLHDVLETKKFSANDMKVAGFSEFVISHVRTLTRDSGVSYDGYISVICQSPLSAVVKRADLIDNLRWHESGRARLAPEFVLPISLRDRYTAALRRVEVAATSWESALLSNETYTERSNRNALLRSVK